MTAKWEKTNWSCPINSKTLNLIEICSKLVNVRTSANTSSAAGQGVLIKDEGGTHRWKGMSMDDLS